MDRRHFLKLSGSAFLYLNACFPKRNEHSTPKYGIEINSDMNKGHLLFEKQLSSSIKTQDFQTLIVGGGIAGITAAYQLKQKSFILCELSDRIGGSSSSIYFKDTPLCQGAHYEVNYPDYFGKEAIEFLEDLGIISFNPLTEYWDFKDKKYIIPEDQLGQSKVDGLSREDVFYGTPQSKEFLYMVEKYLGKLYLPTRAIHKDFHDLNQISFKEFLDKNLKPKPAIIQAFNYQMKDDFGGTYDQVSALAGLYYYASRPYWGDKEQIFSPPQGNYYFIEKMLQKIPQEQIYLKHLVTKIQKEKKRFKVEVLDFSNQTLKKFYVNQIIYAGQKHALKYIYPEDAPLFDQNQYAPWLVANIILNKQITQEVFWQNEILGKDQNLLGFVDSAAQDSTAHSQQVFTVYFCFSPDQRELLKEISQSPQPFVKEILVQLSSYLSLDRQIIEEHIEKVFIKVMGHAMPIPLVNYLFNDKNQMRSEANLVYAGVDNSRLPLLMEAIDSGLEAVKLLKM